MCRWVVSLRWNTTIRTANSETPRGLVVLATREAGHMAFAMARWRAR